MLAFYDFAQSVLIPVQLVLAMLGMGLTMSPRDFAAIAKNPSGVALGLALQLIFVPLIAVAFIEVFSLSKGWAVGLVLVAVVPGGAWSNLLTFLGKGNAALSIAVTTASTSACIVTIPLLLSLLAEAHVPPEFELDRVRIILEIFGYLLAPLALGMALLPRMPRAAPSLSRWCIRGSITLIVVITIAALGSGRMTIGAYGWKPPLVIIGFGVLVVEIVPIALRLLRRYDDDNVALTIEVAIRNMGVGLLLVHNFFPDEEAQGHVLYTCLFYAGLSFFIGVPPAYRHAKGKSVASFFAPYRRPSEEKSDVV